MTSPPPGIGIGKRAGNGVYYAYETGNAKKTRQSLHVRTYEEALEKAHRLFGDRSTLQDAIQLAWTNRWRSNKDGEQSLRQAKTAEEYFGAEALLSDLTATTIHEYQQWLSDEHELTPSTVNRYSSALKVVLKTAQRFGKLSTVPYIGHAKEPEGRLYTLSKVDEVLLLGCLNEDTRALAAFLVDVGCRLGEALKLAQRDVRNSHATFRDTKNGTSRTIPLTRRAASLWTLYGPWERPQWYYQKEFRRVRELYWPDQDDFVLHMLRHTCCTRLIEAGVPLMAVKEWMGHASITTTQRYAHVSANSLMNALEALQR